MAIKDWKRIGKDKWKKENMELKLSKRADPIWYFHPDKPVSTYVIELNNVMLFKGSPTFYFKKSQAFKAVRDYMRSH